MHKVGTPDTGRRAFVGNLRLVNPGARLILTVPPVPLVATFAPQHVLVSTTHSKAVLRVAAEIACREHDDVFYFPSFEIITGNYNRGRHFGKDLRSVTEQGVDHVMAVFMRHLTEHNSALTVSDAKPAAVEDTDEEIERMAEAACDEELLQRK